MSLILSKVRDPDEMNRNWLRGAPLARVAYMDDLVGWSARTETLQSQMQNIQAEMEKWGLKVNLEKSAMICFGEVGEKKIHLRGQEFVAQADNTPLMVMGLPVGPRVTSADFMEALCERARKGFRARWKVLHSQASFNQRNRVLDRVCFGSISWVVGTVHPTVAGMKMLNQLQMEFLVSMLGWRRSEGELWVEFRQRAFRGARNLLHSMQKERWSTMYLRLCWRYLGHRARNGHLQNPGCAGVLSTYRTLRWWKREHGLSGGERHRRRHYPRLMGNQREVEENVEGRDWLEAALDKKYWASREGSWLERRDVAWSSGSQFAVEG